MLGRRLLILVVAVALLTGCRVRAVDSDGSEVVLEPAPSAPVPAVAPPAQPTQPAAPTQPVTQPAPPSAVPRGWLHKLPEDTRVQGAIDYARKALRAMIRNDWERAAIYFSRAGRLVGQLEVVPPDDARKPDTRRSPIREERRTPPAWAPTRDRSDDAFDELDELTPASER